MFLQSRGKRTKPKLFFFLVSDEFVGHESKPIPLTHQLTEINWGEASDFIVSVKWREYLWNHPHVCKDESARGNNRELKQLSHLHKCEKNTLGEVLELCPTSTWVELFSFPFDTEPFPSCFCTSAVLWLSEKYMLSLCVCVSLYASEDKIRSVSALISLLNEDSN